MTKLDQLKSLLQSHGLWAKKSLGQNFLVDEKAMQAIVDAAELTSADNIVEVGPGTGFLTEKLIKKVDGYAFLGLGKYRGRLFLIHVGKRAEFSVKELKKRIKEAQAA